MRRARKLEELLRLVRAGAGEHGIYALAAAAGRPYRRVHDQVRRLAASGLVELAIERHGSRARVRVVPVERPALPALQFDRAWSRPSGHIDTDTAIGLVLARPTFADILSCCLECGIERVRDIFDRMIVAMQLDPGAAEESARMLSNIEIGRARASRAIDRVEQDAAAQAIRRRGSASRISGSTRSKRPGRGRHGVARKRRP